MSHIYRVGDRVRLARPNYPENLGHEGTIRCFVPEGRGYLGRKFNCRIDWDAKSLNGCTDHSHTDQLEPIQRSDDKSQSTDHDTEIDDLAAKVVADLLRKHEREFVNV